MKLLMLVGASVIVAVVLASLLNRLIGFFFVSMVLSVGLASALFILFVWRWGQSLPSREHVAVLGALLAGTVTLAVLFAGPLQVDRSISVWMLSHLDSNTMHDGTGGVTKLQLSEDFNEFVTQDYVEFTRRYHEQITLGNVQIDEEGVVSLTWSGALLADLFELTRTFFATESRYIPKALD